MTILPFRTGGFYHVPPLFAAIEPAQTRPELVPEPVGRGSDPNRLPLGQGFWTLSSPNPMVTLRDPVESGWELTERSGNRAAHTDARALRAAPAAPRGRSRCRTRCSSSPAARSSGPWRRRTRTGHAGSGSGSELPEDGSTGWEDCLDRFIFGVATSFSRGAGSWRPGRSCTGYPTGFVSFLASVDRFRSILVP